MLLSFRGVRNLWLGFILIIIVSKSVFSYLVMNDATRRLDKIVNIEGVKISRYLEIAELANALKEKYLIDFLNKRISGSSPVIFLLDEISKRVNIIKNIGISVDEAKVLEQIVFSIPRFKSKVSDYEKKIDSEPKDSASFIETRQFLLGASEDIVQLSRVLNQNVRQSIEAENRIILTKIVFFKKILILAFVLGVIIVFLTLLAMSRAIAYPIKQLLFGAEAITRGDLGYSIKFSSKDEFGKLALAFNKMSCQLKESQKELFKSKEALTRIIEGIEEAVMLIDRDYRIIWTNKRMLNSFSPQDAIGNFCYKITHNLGVPCQAPDDACPMDEAIKTGNPATVNHVHFDKDGNRVYVEITVYPLRDKQGEIDQFIHLCRDVTKNIQLEKDLKDNIFKLEASKAELQRKIKELEAFTKLAVYREIKMIELKERVRELESGGRQNT